MNKIKEYRLLNNMTVRELSNKAHVAVGYISILENDHTDACNPTKCVMVKIATALNKSVPDVFFPRELERLIQKEVV